MVSVLDRIIECPQCKAKFTLSEVPFKIKGASIKFRCCKCSAKLALTRPVKGVEPRGRPKHMSKKERIRARLRIKETMSSFSEEQKSDMRQKLRRARKEGRLK